MNTDTTFRLTLCDHQGVILNTWTIGDESHQDADVTYPIQKFGASDLLNEINSEIEKSNALV